MACPAENALVGFLEGKLAGVPADELERHLVECAPCASLVAEFAHLSGDEAAAVPVSPAPARPAAETLGRYQLIDLLGSGGMGTVYAAFDPELGRRVAVKVVQLGSGEREAELMARLLREAHAMARLSHPNVVAVHDVGAADGQVFIAMELVDGVTLAQWLRATRRSWREVLDVLRDAGRGLAAATPPASSTATSSRPTCSSVATAARE